MMERCLVSVPIPKHRASWSDVAEGLEVIIPARRHVFAILFLPVWLAGWLFGEVMVIRQLLEKPADGQPSLFLFVWLVMWTAFGGLALKSLLWMLCGRERVVLRPDALLVRRELFGIARAREYEIGSISNLRVSPATFNPWDGRSSWKPGGMCAGVIAFDYGARTFRFAEGIDEAEGHDIVALMRQRHTFRTSPDAVQP